MIDEYDDEYKTCGRTYASLRIIHNDLNPDEITLQLGIQPTWAWRRGQPRAKGKAISRIGIWGLNTESIESHDLRRHIDWLLDQVATKEGYLKQLQAQGYRMDVFCFWLSSGQGGPTISPKNMQGLAKLGIELGFDFWMGDGDDADSETP